MTLTDRRDDAGGPLADDDAAGRIARAVQAASGPGTTTSPADAVRAVAPEDVERFLHARFAGSDGLAPLGTGVPASPGAASGRVVLTAGAAIEAAARGEAVILVRRETTPDDVPGMQAARGVLTARGGLASHAAVVARGWGVPAVVGLEALQLDTDGFTLGGRRIEAGDLVSIDGHSGEVFAGGVEVATAVAPPELDTLLGWADQVRRAGGVAVRANADSAVDAAYARSQGAEGIGLCRTEHMFLAEDRLALVRRLILSDDPVEDGAALAALEEAQVDDFAALLAAMDGLPVTIRLLDPPLHEFLPPLEPLAVAEALGQLDDGSRAELAAVRRLHETNPMIGTRGIRLGVAKPGLYPMQVRAIGRAVAALRAQGRSPQVEVMIPLVVSARELRIARRWVEEATASVAGAGPVSVGTMIETPRSALVAGELAEVADFFSFGTNDLTQLTFAFSRDDVEAKLLPHYLAAGLLDGNPFEILDQAGVGFLVRHAVDAGRAARPGLEIGTCGEQAGDPRSARFLVDCGLDYVSCSPHRLPVVRLAVAQALLALGRSDGTSLRPGAAAEPGDRAEARGGPPTAAGPAGDAAAVPAKADGARGPGRAGGVDGASGAEGVGTGSDEVRADAAFRVVHALKIKGFAPAATVAEVAAVPLAAVEAELDRLASEGLADLLEARGFWQLTGAGREHHAALLPGAPADAVERLRAAYPPFVARNVAFKDLCTAWQVRDGQPNDHTDAAYDAARIADLVAHDVAAGPALDALADAVERLGAYRPRLRAAAERLAAGEDDMFTGVLKGSYHDIWMELHEDLICVLGIDRAAEGSF